MAKLIVVGGATASGKSDLAIVLCRQLGGEVISCDSMQLYRGMDIGTATPTLDEMGAIPHHLISVLAPGQPCSAAAYRQMALPVLRDVQRRGRTPILCGGTGLYIDALTKPLGFSVEGDRALRARLEARDRQELHRQLGEIDPQAAARLHVNDVRRVIRALEVYMLTGKTLSWHMENDRTRPGDYEGALFCLDWPREALYERIDRRVDRMMAAGLEDEVRALLAGGLARGDTAMQAIGYKELAAYVAGECTRAQAVDAIKQATRHYAKRQLTWFRRDARVTWLDAQHKDMAQLAQEIVEIIKKREDA